MPHLIPSYTEVTPSSSSSTQSTASLPACQCRTSLLLGNNCFDSEGQPNFQRMPGCSPSNRHPGIQPANAKKGISLSLGNWVTSTLTQCSTSATHPDPHTCRQLPSRSLQASPHPRPHSSTAIPAPAPPTLQSGTPRDSASPPAPGAPHMQTPSSSRKCVPHLVPDHIVVPRAWLQPVQHCRVEHPGIQPARAVGRGAAHVVPAEGAATGWESVCVDAGRGAPLHDWVLAVSGGPLNTHLPVGTEQRKQEQHQEAELRNDP
jgi:hypothetical protein